MPDSAPDLDWEFARLHFQAVVKTYHTRSDSHVHPETSRALNAIHERYRSGERSGQLYALMMNCK